VDVVAVLVHLDAGAVELVLDDAVAVERLLEVLGR
jgi:hypothetical protein